MQQVEGLDGAGVAAFIRENPNLVIMVLLYYRRFLVNNGLCVSAYTNKALGYTCVMKVRFLCSEGEIVRGMCVHLRRRGNQWLHVGRSRKFALLFRIHNTCHQILHVPI